MMRPLAVQALLSLLLLATPAAALERYPTAHRFGISLGFGFGSAALSSFHEGVDDVKALVERSNPGLVMESAPKSNLQINAEIGFRYYFPYYILAQVGSGAVYNKASVPFTIGPAAGTLNTDQLALEVPILVGGHYPFLGRLWVFGAVGPTPFFYVRSWVSYDPGGHSVADLKANTRVGFHALAGAEFLVTRGLALGLELRYRYLKSGELQMKDGTVVTQHMFLGNGSSRTYDLDLSGISLGLTIRAFAF